MNGRIIHSLIFIVIVFLSQSTFCQNNQKLPTSTVYNKLSKYMSNHKDKNIQYPISKVTTYNTIHSIPLKLLAIKSNHKHLIVNFPIMINNLTISQALYLNFSKFLQPIILHKIIFQKPINIAWTSFLRSTHYYNLIFKKSLIINNCLFREPMQIYKSTIIAMLDFTSNRFNSIFTISHSVIKQNSDFSNSTFFKGIDLTWSEFDNIAKFHHSKFYGDSNFNNTTFFNGLDLSDSQLDGALSMSKVIIKGELNLRNMKISKNNKLDLRKIEPLNTNQKILINLQGATLDNIILNYHNFTLHFDDKTNHQQIINTYTSLLDYFQKEGSTKSYEKLFLEYNSYKNHYHNNHISDYLSRYFWNYGLNKELAVKWIIYIFILFTFINTFMYPTLAKDYSLLPFFSNIVMKNVERHNIISRFVFFLPYSLLYTLILMAGAAVRLSFSINTLKGDNIFIFAYLIISSVIGLWSMIFLITQIV